MLMPTVYLCNTSSSQQILYNVISLGSLVTYYEHTCKDTFKKTVFV